MLLTPFNRIANISATSEYSRTYPCPIHVLSTVFLGNHEFFVCNCVRKPYFIVPIYFIFYASFDITCLANKNCSFKMKNAVHKPSIIGIHTV